MGSREIINAREVKVLDGTVLVEIPAGSKIVIMRYPAGNDHARESVREAAVNVAKSLKENEPVVVLLPDWRDQDGNQVFGVDLIK